MKSVLLVFAMAAASAGVSEPRLGIAVGSDGIAREVMGTEGNIVLGESAGPAIAAACSAAMCILKKDTSVQILGGDEFDAPAGPALIGFDTAGTTAYAYFAVDRSFARITPAGVEQLPVDAALLGGDVVAVSGLLTIYVRRNDGLHAVRVRASDGAIEKDDALNLDAQVGAALPDGLVYAADSDVVVNGERIDAGGRVLALTQIGSGWMHVRTEFGSRALRVRAGRASLYYIPQVKQ